jgi:hypothetical protein
MFYLSLFGASVERFFSMPPSIRVSPLADRYCRRTRIGFPAREICWAPRMRAWCLGKRTMVKTISRGAICFRLLGASTHAKSTIKVGTHILAETENGDGDLLVSQRAPLSRSPRPIRAPSTPTSAVIPADRMFSWNPRIMSKGRVPNRTTICATLSPSGGNDPATIQSKLDSCPSNHVAMLNLGTFIINRYLLISVSASSPRADRGQGCDGVGGQIGGGGLASKQRSVGQRWRYIIADARCHAPILHSVIGRSGSPPSAV